MHIEGATVGVAEHGSSAVLVTVAPGGGSRLVEAATILTQGENGFGSRERMRRAFVRAFGLSPRAVQSTASAP
jgi:hypothetical protein